MLKKNLVQKYGHSHFKSAFGINFRLREVVKLKIRKYGICVTCAKIVGCVYLTHILQKPCSTTTMAVYAIYEATAKKLELASGKSRLATLF